MSLDHDGSRCPDWKKLVELQDSQPERWDAALEHLDDCPRCMESAFDNEPTVLFRQLPTVTLDADEIAAMKQTVAALCRTEELQEPPRRRTRNWLRAASLAAAVLAAAHVPSLFDSAPPAPVDVASTHTVDTPIAAEPAVMSPQAVGGELAPLIEDVDPAYGSVVQVVDQDFSLVLVLPTQDV